VFLKAFACLPCPLLSSRIRLCFCACAWLKCVDYLPMVKAMKQLTNRGSTVTDRHIRVESVTGSLHRRRFDLLSLQSQWCKVLEICEFEECGNFGSLASVLLVCMPQRWQIAFTSCNPNSKTGQRKLPARKGVHFEAEYGLLWQ